jgi:nucleotide-binding universal stress UspA family protein
MFHFPLAATARSTHPREAFVFRRILVATDGSESACAALRLAAALARRDGSYVFVISVLDPPWPQDSGPEALDPARVPVVAERRRKLVGTLEQQIRDCEVDPSTWIVHTETGSPATSIARYATDHHVELLLLGIGTHTRADRWLGDETALRVIQSAQVPILAVHPESRALPRCAVAALDFSDFSMRAARLAAEVLDPSGDLHLVHVSHLPPQRYDWEKTIDADTLHHQQEEALATELTRTGGPRVTSHVVKGPGPAEQLLEFARTHDADLIASGTHGRGFASRLLMGSVATALVRGATCSVLVVPPAEEAKG